MADKIKRSVEYDITAIDNASSKFENVHSSAKKNLGGVGDIAMGVGTAVVGFGAIAGTAAIAMGGFAISAADDLEKGLLKFETLLGSEEEAQERMAELTEFATKTPFQLDDIVKADVMLQGFGIRSEELLGNIGDAAAISGSSISDLSLIFGQLSQDKSLENIRQLVDRGVISFDELSAAGIEFAEDRSIVNSVEETYGAVVGIVENKFAGGMDKLSGTVSGKMSTLKDTFTLALANIGEESGLQDFTKDVLDFLIVELPPAIEKGKEVLEEIAESVEEFIAPFIDKLPEVIETVKNFFEDNKDTITENFEEIKDTVQDSFELIINTVSMLKDGWDNNFLGIKTSIMTVINTVVYLGKTAFEIFGGIIEMLSFLADNYEFYWNKMKLTTYEFVNDTIDTIESWADTILTPINAVRSALGKSAITADFSGAKIDTTYEKAYVESFAPETDISDIWAERSDNMAEAAISYFESMAQLQQEEKAREQAVLEEKEVVINNYYNNQLNDNMTVDRMLERANIKQREQLQSYGVNVI